MQTRPEGHVNQTWLAALQAVDEASMQTRPEGHVNSALAGGARWDTELQCRRAPKGT